jgi:hypothetical protein
LFNSGMRPLKVAGLEKRKVRKNNATVTPIFSLCDLDHTRTGRNR